MANQLSLIVCGSLEKEARAVSVLPELKNVEIATLAFDCDQVDGGWDGLGPLVRKEIDSGRTVYAVGGFCLTQALAGLGLNGAVRAFQKSQCAEWAADKDVLDKFLQEEYLIVLPGWLRSWERAVEAKWHGDRKRAQGFFREASRKIVLVDTGIYPKIERELKEFSQFLRLPAERYPVGLSHFGLSLGRLAQDWRLEREAEASDGRLAGFRQKMADYARLGHLLGPLAKDLSEEDAVAGVLEVFRVLLSPQSVVFHSFRTLSDLSKPEGSALDRILSLNADYAWTDDRRSVFLSVTYDRKVLGIIEVCGLPAPERSELDLSLGLALAKVAGIALANAASLKALGEESERAEAAQTALKVSEEKVLSAYQGSPVGLYRMTPPGQFLDANPAMARILGFPDVLSLKAANAWDLHLNPGDRESWQSVLGSSHFNQTFETQMRRRDGTLIWVRDTTRAVRDRTGRTLFFDGALEDITKRKQMDSASSWNLQFRTSLAAVSGRLLTTASVVDMSCLVLEHARRLTSSPTCLVVYMDGRTERLMPGAMTADAAALGDRLPEGGWSAENTTGLWSWVLRNKKPLLTNLPTIDPRFNHLPEWHFPVTQFLCVPALAGDEIVGLIAVANSETPYSEREIDAIGRLAELYAIAIYRLRADEKLQEMSLVDELTRLYNRRGFLTLAEQQFRVAHRSKKEMYLLYADLDDLKMINDKFGHETGDAALVETAALLKDVFRESDIIARMGGDEFVILAVDVGEGKADVLAQRLKEKFEARNAQPGQPLALSISVGVARYDPESPGSIQDLITSADKLMYVDKEAHRKPGASQGQEMDVRP